MSDVRLETSIGEITVQNPLSVYKRKTDERFIYVDRQSGGTGTLYDVTYDETGVDDYIDVSEWDPRDYERVPPAAARSPARYLKAYVLSLIGTETRVSPDDEEEFLLGAEYATNVCKLLPVDQMGGANLDEYIKNTYKDPWAEQFYRASRDGDSSTYDVVRTDSDFQTTVEEDVWEDVTDEFDRVPKNAVLFPAAYILKNLPFTESTHPEPAPDTGGTVLGVEYALEHTKITPRQLTYET
jgi:hypothetical protein